MLKNAFWIFAAAVLILVIFLPTFSKKQKLLEKNRQYRAQIQDLKQQIATLSEEKRNLEEDPVYRERVAREKMGLVRDGEVIFKITPAPVDAEVVHE